MTTSKTGNAILQMTSSQSRQQQQRRPTDSASSSSRLPVLAVLVVFVLLHAMSADVADAMPRSRQQHHQRRGGVSSWSAKKQRDLDGTQQQPLTADDPSNNGLREGRCVVERVYEECYMCGRIVENRDIYYGCCNGEERVLDFCQQLLF